MQMPLSRAHAICEEFSERVSRLCQYNIKDPQSSSWSGEIKCVLEFKYFTPLAERLLGVGYCCTQVQKDSRKRLCTAWFEPQSPD